MNKSELIKRVAHATDISQKEAGELVNATLNVIKEALKQGEKVSLIGFGIFEVRKRAARMARNPQTGELIREGRVPTFKPGKQLKEAVN